MTTRPSDHDPLTTHHDPLIMPINVYMPQLGESVEEGTLSKWLKREGDRVAEFEPLMEVNTDKVDTEVPAPAAGVVLKLLVEPGTVVKAGAVVALIGSANEQAGLDTARPPAPAVPPPPPASRRELGFISPVVAKLADEYQVDLRQLTGTGLNGRITKKDVLAHVEARAAAPAPDPTPAPVVVVSASAPAQPAPVAAPAPTPAADFVPVNAMRRSIAEHMVKSLQVAAQATTVFEADLSAVVAHQKAHATTFKNDGVSLTLTAYFVSAIVAGLKAHPLLNSQWAEDKIALRRELNVGLAVALEEGLIVPVIHNAAEKSLLGLARTINDLAKRARTKSLTPDEVKGATFTLTNHGVTGSLFATPILSLGQTGILGVGTMQKRVVVVGDAIAIRPMVYLSLTFDHRVIDGAAADRFMQVVKQTLEGWGAGI